jgi:hypothetical protein
VRLISRFASLLGVALVLACLAVVGPASASGNTAPTVTVTPSPSPGTTGPVSYAVAVAGQSGSPTPTGAVLVWDGTNTCVIHSLDGTGSGSCSIDETPGTYSITATYAGDSNYSSALGTANETVAQATPSVTVTPQSGATTGLVDYAVTVTGTGPPVPTGSVSIGDGSSSCQTGPLDGTGSGSCSIEESAGSYSIIATYSGDTNYSGAEGTVSETVGQATPAVAVTPQAGATTGLVSYQVSVAGPAGAVVPTGSVQVSDGSNVCTAALTSGAGGCSIEETAGGYSITASYGGDTNYSNATGTGSETVGLGLPAVTVTPSAGATTGLVSYGVSVAGPAGAVVPTGSVQVSDGSNVCTAALTSGAGSCSIAEGAGGYSLTGTYSGDGNYSGATGTASETVAQAIAVVKGAAPANAVAGDLSFAVTVAGSSSAIVPTGTVLVSVLDVPGSPTCTITLAAGAGNCPLFLTPAKYTVKFTYSGDPNYLAPTPPLVSETVGFAPESVSVTANVNPATAKANGKVKVAYTVTVTGESDLPDPTGSVLVADETGASCSIPSITAGVGTCSFIEVFGTHTVTATTSGDGDYNFGTGTTTEYVGTNTTTTFSKTGNPVLPGGVVTLKAKIKSVTTTAGTPSGTVAFVVNGVAQPPEPVNNGVATLAYTVPSGTSAGKVPVTVDFQTSDSNTWFGSSTSGQFTVS